MEKSREKTVKLKVDPTKAQDQEKVHRIYLRDIGGSMDHASEPKVSAETKARIDKAKGRVQTAPEGACREEATARRGGTRPCEALRSRLQAALSAHVDQPRQRLRRRT